MTTAEGGRPPVECVGILGGTGAQGRGLAVRLAAAGCDVLLGSRDTGSATAVAEKVRGLAATLGEAEPGSVDGGTNLDVAERADLVVVAVPHAGHRELLGALGPALRGKVVVDCVVPMGFDEKGAFLLPVPEGSMTEQAAELLPGSTVVGAFHHVAAHLLEDVTHPTVDCDVLVVGDVRAATDTVQSLADLIPGMRGVYAGRLRSARQIEGLTVNLVSVNRRYKVHAGLRITDLQEDR